MWIIIKNAEYNFLPAGAENQFPRERPSHPSGRFCRKSSEKQTIHSQILLHQKALFLMAQGESTCIIFHAFPAGQVIFCPTTKYKRKGFQKSSHILHTVVLILYTIFVIFEQSAQAGCFSARTIQKLSPNNRREFFFPIIYFHIRASRSPAFAPLLIDTGTAPPAAV